MNKLDAIMKKIAETEMERSIIDFKFSEETEKSPTILTGTIKPEVLNAIPLLVSMNLYLTKEGPHQIYIQADVRYNGIASSVQKAVLIESEDDGIKTVVKGINTVIKTAMNGLYNSDCLDNVGEFVSREIYNKLISKEFGFSFGIGCVYKVEYLSSTPGAVETSRINVSCENPYDKIVITRTTRDKNNIIISTSGIEVELIKELGAWENIQRFMKVFNAINALDTDVLKLDLKV